MSETTQNPFGALAVRASGAMAQATESREVAEIQAAMTIAKRFPRDQVMAMDRILNACTRKTLAESALYSYNRGGAEVTGPSIRLAEVLAQAWGNLQFGVRELDQTDGGSTVEAYCWDLETNCKDSKVFQVAHERHTKAGTKKLTDPRDIYEAVANVGARRKRACILAVIPGDVVEAAVAQCDVTLAANADVGPESVRKLAEAFAAFGVTKEQIEARLTNRLDAIRPAQMISLRKIYTSLRDGISVPGDWFQLPSDTRAIVEEIQHSSAQRSAGTTPQGSAQMDEYPRNLYDERGVALNVHQVAAYRASRSASQEPTQAAPQPAQAQETADSAEWPKEHNGNLYDSRGVVWDGVVHSGAKSCNADGTWRRRKGVHPDSVAQAEARYPRIDPLTTFGGGPAVESGSNAPVLELSGAPGVADVMGWIAEAQDEEELDLSMDAARDVEMSERDRQLANAAAERKYAELRGD